MQKYTYTDDKELVTRKDDIMDLLQSELGASQMDLVDDLVNIVIELTARHGV